MSEEQKMTEMNAWLDEACAALGVDRAEMAEVTPAVLRLVSQVAHGRSRPAAPLTAMVVGVAAMSGEDGFVPGIHSAIERLQPLLETPAQD